MSQQPPLPYHIDYAPLPKSRVRKVFKIALYFTGVLIAEFGLIGVPLVASGYNNQVGDIAIVIGILALIGSLFIFFRKGYSVHYLSWKQYLLWILGATIAAIVAIVAEFALVPDLNTNDKSMPIPSAIFAGIIFLYGIALLWTAHIKPPLRQLVDESVLSILQNSPAKQISLAELLARLQREFNCSDTILNQMINSLDYVEQIDIPGTNTRVCQLKGMKGKVLFPQVYGITTDGLRQSVRRAISMLNENEVDLGLFSLSRDFENTLKAYLIAASAKGKFQIPTKDPPERWKLAHMIDWARNDRIITDNAILNYLRQERNNRAHGGMPSLAERKLLMKNVQHLAGLYIDYIKLLDNLIYSL